MSVVPKKKAEKIAWFRNHVSTWTSVATSIGLTAAEVLDLGNNADAAQDALDAQSTKKAAAESATLDLDQKLLALSTTGSDLLAKIRARGKTDPSVYVLADVPAPATPSPVGPPGKPTDFSAELSEGGALTIKWTCSNPANSSGTVYEVARRIGASGPFTILGSTGLKHMADPTIPAGTAQVTYRVIAIRSTSSGPEALFTVYFGVGGAGEMTASVVEGPGGTGAPKLAA
jgi:hypothetical protein